MQLGILEGFFGSPWSWEARHDALPFMLEHGFGLYFYAPKADRFLRGRWQERHPSSEEAAIRTFAEACRSQGIDFAIGLSPLDLFHSWNDEGRSILERRIRELRALGIDGLGLFFDDMRGDLPDLAATQAAIASTVRAAHPDLRLWLCPTYYTPHDVLDRVFGQRPENYLEDLGAQLPADVEVFWTGEKVCSTSYNLSELQAVQARLGRPLAIWDNYPVNDGPKMCKHLHLRPPGGRGPELSSVVSTWCCNPMNQPVASRLPLAAIAGSLRGKPPDLQALSARLFGDCATEALLTWVDRFQDQGLDQFENRDEALRIFSALPDPLSAEIVHWLKGHSVVGSECLTDTDEPE